MGGGAVRILAAMTLLAALVGCARGVPPDDLEYASMRRSEARQIESSVRHAFGAMCTTVSVVPVELRGFTDDGGSTIDGFRLQYTLRECGTSFATFGEGNQELTYGGAVPPLTRPGAYRKNETWSMSPDKLRELLRVFGQMVDRPVATVLPCSAYNWNSVVLLDGETYDYDELWVVTPGSRTLAELQKHQADDTGYLFLVRDGDEPRLMRKIEGSAITFGD